MGAPSGLIWNISRRVYLKNKMQKTILDFFIKYNSEFYRNFGMGKSHLIPLSHELERLIRIGTAPELIPLPLPSPDLSPEGVISIVAEVTGCSYMDITGNDKRECFVEIRHLAIYFISMKFPRMTQSAIALFFSGRSGCGLDHSTVIYAIKKVKNLCETDKNYLKKFVILERKICG